MTTLEASRDWKRRNPERVKEYEREYKSRRKGATGVDWKRAQRTEVTDWYVLSLLRLRDAPPEVLEAKRWHVKVERLIKELSK